jgi:hypothetical protein
MVAIGCMAQTQPVPSQIAWPATTEPLIMMLTAQGITFAKLDTSVVFDLATGTIKAKATSPTLYFTEEPLAAQAGVWSIPVGCMKIALYRNGLKQHSIDYTVLGNTITWLPVSTPQPGDIISISCARQAP